MKKQGLSFFRRLLLSFVLCSIIPLFLLAFVFTGASSRVLKKNTARQAKEIVSAAAGMMKSCLAEAYDAGSEIAEDSSVISWCAGNGTELEASGRTSDIFQKIARLKKDTSFHVYILSQNPQKKVLSRNQIPDEYQFKAYAGWGVLKKVSDSNECVLFVQPHPENGEQTIAAAAIPVFSDSAKKTRVGFVIVDILRRGLFDQFSLIAGIQGRFDQLMVYDKSGCIAFSAFSPDKEASFFTDNETQNDGRSFYSPVGRDGLTVCGILPETGGERYINDFRSVALIIALITSIVSFAVALILSRSIAQPVQELTKTMLLVESGDLSVRCPETSNARTDTEMSFLIGRFNHMIERIAKLSDDRVEQQRLLRVAEIKRLQAQISPHFLYNTLNSIKSMAKLAGVNDIARMVTNLGKILHDGFTSGEDFCSIEKSLELVHNYFDIESARWENKFTFIEKVDPRLLPYPLPRFVIQPVVENALVHGLEEKNEHGTLTINGFFEERNDGSADIVIEVRDDGAGIPEAKLKLIQNSLEHTSERQNVIVAQTKIGGGEDKQNLGSNGIALVNTHLRLRLLYGNEYGLTIQSTEGAGTVVTIRAPREGKHDESSYC